MIELYLFEWLTITILHCLALISPGPDFAIVSKNSITHGSRAGLWVSAGIASGVTIHVLYCMIGIGAIISNSVLLFNLVKYLGAAYLIYLGLKTFFSKQTTNSSVDSLEFSTALQGAQPQSDRKNFLMGFTTNILNPKATLFFLAIFSSTIHPDTPMAIQAFYGLWLSTLTFIWFSLVSLFFSQSGVQRKLNTIKDKVDKGIGLLLVTIGIKLSIMER